MGLFSHDLPEHSWRTRDGRVVRITEMDDAHLIRTIRYLRSKTQAIRRASWHYEDIDEVIEATWGPDPNDDRTGEQVLRENVPQYRLMLREALRRALALDYAPPAPPDEYWPCCGSTGHAPDCPGDVCPGCCPRQHPTPEALEDAKVNSAIALLKARTRPARVRR